MFGQSVAWSVVTLLGMSKTSHISLGICKYSNVVWQMMAENDKLTNEVNACARSVITIHASKLFHLPSHVFSLSLAGLCPAGGAQPRAARAQEILDGGNQTNAKKSSSILILVSPTWG